MAEVDEKQSRLLNAVYESALRDARADLGADLRELAERFVCEVHTLRIELRRALGLPPLIEAEPDEHESAGTLQ